MVEASPRPQSRRGIRGNDIGSMTHPTPLHRPQAHDRHMSVVRVVLCDSNYLVRAGIRGSLGGHRAMRVVAELALSLELVAAADAADAQLVVVGLDGAGGAANDAIRQIKARRPETRVVALAQPDDGDAILAALRAGVDGCVSREADRRDLLDVLARAAAGTPAIEPALAALLLRRLADQAAVVPVAPPEPLTQREREVLAMMARGKTNREIAGRLVVAVGTVKIHVEHILAKLNVSDRTAAAVRGVELGLVDLTPVADDERSRVRAG